jgi:hypothetical protein
MALRRPGFYRSDVGNYLPNFPPRSGLKKGPISLNIGQKSPIVLNKINKSTILKFKNHFMANIGHRPQMYWPLVV